jgi:PadR family transcriptional regulator, regulatory protein AphA
MSDLTVTSYLVLGMIRLRGPSTSYELKRAVGRSVGYFWPFPHAQLYREPVHLVEAGLLEEQQESEGRRRRVYTITPAGEEALREWLREPVHKMLELRDLAQLKLFFSEVMSTGELVALARNQEALHRARLAEYEHIAAHYRDRPGFDRRMAPLSMGLMLEQDEIRFWSTIAEDPPNGSPVAREEQEEAHMGSAYGSNEKF